MDNIEVLKLFTLVIMFLLTLVTINGIVMKILRHKEYINHINSNSEENITGLLDNFISDTLGDYVSLNPAKFNMGETVYINPEDEMGIIREVSTLVGERLSVHMIDKLSLYYTSSMITDVIATKVFVHVSIFIANLNDIEVPKKEKSIL